MVEILVFTLALVFSSLEIHPVDAFVIDVRSQISIRTATAFRPLMNVPDHRADPVEASPLRRQLLALLPTALLGAPSAHAVMMENKQTVFATGQPLGIPESKARFREARKSLLYLLDNYGQIVKEGGGDNIRRYLGTVGTNSGLYGITKVLKELQEVSNDIVEYTENMTDFDYYLRAADTAAYSALFVEYSAAKTKPEQFFADARIAAENMLVCMDRMAAELL